MLSGHVYSLAEIVLVMLKMVVGSAAVGVLVGCAFLLCIRGVSDKLEHASGMLQISLTFCNAYWSFHIAETLFGMSGVLSTVTASLVLADNM